MKKIFLFVACAALMGLGAKAQTVEELFKNGKAAFDKYDKLLGEYIMAHQQNPDAPDATGVERAELIMNGFDMLQKALPMDTIVETNKDGSPKIDKKTGKTKVKTKYSKEIVDLLSGHVNDVVNAGNSYWSSNDFGKAYQAFDFYNKLVDSPLGAGLNVDPSTIAEVLFFQGAAAYQTQDYANAVEAFKKAIAKGYTENQVVDYRNSCIANIIQNLCNDSKYDEAEAYIDATLAESPKEALFQDMKGFVVEQRDGLAAAEKYYEATTQLDPNFANGFYDYGRALYNKAADIIEKNSDKTTKDLAPMVKPIYDKALPLFKRAQELDKDGSIQAGRFVEDIEYKLEQLK